MKKRVVCIGAGTGQASILFGLKNKPIEVFGIVAVTDNGGHSGVIRESLKLPQIGDSRSCLVSVAENKIMKDLFSFRFKDGELKGINLGNLMIAALVQQHGCFFKGVKAASLLLECRANVMPVTNCDTHICAKLENEEEIIGEWEIIQRKPRIEIQKLYLKDRADVNPKCLEVIENADLILIGPGSLRTGVISNFLVEGFAEAVRNSKAKKVYVCNIMTQPGQTDGFDAKRHVQEVEKYLGGKIDVVLMNETEPKGEFMDRYKEEGSEFVKPEKIEECECVICDLLDENNFEERVGGVEQKVGLHMVRHDPEKIASIVLELI